MKSSRVKSCPAFGFLTIVDQPDYGLLGGYLVLTPAGRPLEFHCTAPIKPNRAQQILYGPTLEPYLFGEQIGRALVTGAKTAPLAVFTDREPALALRPFVEVPVVLVLGSEPTVCERGEQVASRCLDRDRPQTALRIDAPHACAGRMDGFQLGRSRLAVPLEAADDRQAVATRLADWAESLDLAEPFQRIREAIEEARRGASEKSIGPHVGRMD
jgi:hypothetical protein